MSKKKKITKKSAPSAAPPAGKFRNRIKELRYVKAAELRGHPFNWREHPPEQRDGVLGSLSELGWIDAAIAYETDDGLQMIDGHLRASLDPDEPVPVLVTDLSEDEARIALATHDPLAGRATTDHETYAALLETVEAEEARLRILLDELESSMHTDSESTSRSRADELEAKTPTEKDMQLLPHEHYDYVLVHARTLHEWHILLHRLGIEHREKSPRTKRIGCGRAITADHLLRILDGKPADNRSKS